MIHDGSSLHEGGGAGGEGGVIEVRLYETYDGFFVVLMGTKVLESVTCRC